MNFNEQSFLCHYGIKGMKWGVRRYQNPDGSLTQAGRFRYYGKVGERKTTAFELSNIRDRQYKVGSERANDARFRVLWDRPDAYEHAIVLQKANKKYKEALERINARIENAKSNSQRNKLETLKEYSMDFPLNDDADPRIREAAIERHSAQNSFYEKLVGSELDSVNMSRVKNDLSTFMDDTNRAEALIEAMKHNLLRTDIGMFEADEIEKRQRYKVKSV